MSTEATAPRVLLVAMPYVHPNSTSLALGLLGEILGQQGIGVDFLHGSLRYPRTPLWDFDGGLRFLTNYAGLLFGAYLAEDIAAYQKPFLDFMLHDYTVERTMHGLNTPDGVDGEQRHISAEQVLAHVGSEIANAGICLDRCEAVAADSRYDIVGFSITFFTQLPASLALARRLKARNPNVKIIFGGSGCVAEQADGFMAVFPELDAVCYTEADDIIVDFVRALRGDGDLADVGGIVYRDASGTIRKTPVPPLRQELDSLPIPNHDSYFAQQAASEWAELAPTIYFETSRGCWWGQKHLCTFCGLSERELAFRSKSPEKLYQELTTLYRRYPTAGYMHPTDDILDTRYFKTLFPELVRFEKQPERPLRLFFEVKSNMRRAQLMLLAMSGVRAVQPGIESFSDEILELMDKGNTGLGQVQFIKWASEAGIDLIYNMLVRNPGETPAAYRAMTRLVPSLTHLPPPSSVVITELERFSPYFVEASKHGLENIRPKPYHKVVFPMVADEDLAKIAYRFDYDHPLKQDAELIAAQREFVRVVNRWRREYKPSQRYYIDRGDHLIVTDVRGPRPLIEILAGTTAELYGYLDAHRPFAHIQRRFPHIDAGFLRTQLATWHDRGLIYSDEAKDEHLALLPRAFEQQPSLDEVLAMNQPAPAPPLAQTVNSRVRLRVAASETAAP
ncbi:MAG: RiPP maturation radical SAM C-methyltransferase [Deltaproteobacteria bacterium]|nr:RiPP maturation radical SAM C-methyltransferase [Deltaproteobacteria bacterium]